MELESYTVAFDCDSEFLCNFPQQFNLPPPPIPPWFDNLPDCLGNCDIFPEVSRADNIQEVFQSIIITLVVSIIITLSVLLASLLVRR